MTQFGRRTAETILSHYLTDVATIRENGVFPINDVLKADTSHQLLWNYFCELDNCDAQEMPSLPIPFSENELAAFMLDGIGTYVRAFYGEWEDGPDEEQLRAFGPLANKPREALRKAYQAYREAEMAVPKLDIMYEEKARRLIELYKTKNTRLNAHYSIFAQDISIPQRERRRRRVTALLEELKKRRNIAVKNSSEAFSLWRKAMVNQLLKAPSMEAANNKIVSPTAVLPLAQSPSVIRHKLRTNLLDVPIQKAIRQANSFDTAAVYSELKDMALAGEKPFTGVFIGSAICYTNDNNEVAKLTKNALAKRIKQFTP
jgi:hypothetical protein